ncbi:MAG: YggT family protein [Dehalococcoidia bacterium]|nr:YggT family protein [Dehalococcoidia bacterium]
MVSIIERIFDMLIFAIVARAILSFLVPRDGPETHPLLASVKKLIGQVTDPIVVPIQRVLPTMGVFDFSPMVAIVVLVIIKSVVAGALG